MNSVRHNFLDTFPARSEKKVEKNDQDQKGPAILAEAHFRHCLGLGFTPAPGALAAYSNDRDGARGSPAIHVDDALTAENALFYDSVIVQLLSQFSVSKIEKKEFRYDGFLGMRLKQTDNFSVSLSQDTKSVKDLPQGVDSFTEGKKQRN